MEIRNYLSVSHKKEVFQPSNELINSLPTRPDQTRPDQTRPDQTRPETMIIHDFIVNYSSDVRRLVAEDLLCFILGDIYDYGSDEDLLDAYYDAGKVKDFDGFFTLVFVSPQGLKIISDQFCSFPVFYAANRFIITTKILEIASFLKSGPNIDELKHYVSTGNNLPGYTIYDGIYSLKHETELEILADSISERRYCTNSVFIDKTYSVELVAQELTQIIMVGYEYLKSKKYEEIVCDLSGGTDSRVTALAAYKTFKKISINTGVKKNDPVQTQKKEGEIANKVRRQCLGNSPVIKHNDSEGKNSPLPHDVLIGGLGGELFKDFFIKRVFPKGKLLKKGLSDVDLFVLIKTKTLGENALVQRMIEHVKRNIDFNLRGDKIIDQVYLKYFVSNWRNKYAAGSPQTMFREIWNPFLTNKFLLACRKIEPKFRFYNNIHSNIVSLIDKRCADIELNVSVFGFYLFCNRPVVRKNVAYYAFWAFMFNLQRLILKCYAILKPAGVKKNIFENQQIISLDPYLFQIVSQINKTDDENVVAFLKHCFFYKIENSGLEINHQ